MTPPATEFDFCWVCNAKWVEKTMAYYTNERRFIVDHGVAYDVCRDCRPYWEAACPLVFELSEKAWTPNRPADLCGGCLTAHYDGLSVFNHLSTLSVGARVFCRDCRTPYDEARELAQAARRGTLDAAHTQPDP